MQETPTGEEILVSNCQSHRNRGPQPSIMRRYVIPRGDAHNVTRSIAGAIVSSLLYMSKRFSMIKTHAKSNQTPLDTLVVRQTAMRPPPGWYRIVGRTI